MIKCIRAGIGGTRQVRTPHRVFLPTTMRPPPGVQMVASKPGVLPSGYLSIDDALDRIDPGVLRDKGSDKERQEFENYLGLNIAAIVATRTVPEPIYREGARRVRRKAAFRRLVALCAYGKVPSALLLDNFTVRAGVPAKFWLDERFSIEMCATGRATMEEPWSQYAHPGPSGWVIVDVDALDAALLADSGRKKPSEALQPTGRAEVEEPSSQNARPGPNGCVIIDADAIDTALLPNPTGTTMGEDLQRRLKILRANPEGCALIHEAIEAVFSLAKEQAVKPPNVREVIKPVQTWLHMYRLSTAPGNLIETLAGDKRHQHRRRKRGATVAGRLRPVSDIKV